MSSAQDHYARLLAEHYTWMSGGCEQKVADNQQLFASLGLAPQQAGKALDLGCGSGFQSLALAELGFKVLAVDTSAELLAELQSRAAGRPITTVLGDMVDASLYAAQGPFELAVCMGDSLVHLASFDEVSRCLAGVRQQMEPGGTLVLTFRDLTRELTGIDRALPVRLDAERLMATFLEYQPEHVVVNDMVFQQASGQWELKKSAYRKLRVDPQRLTSRLGELGYREPRYSIERGLVTLLAQA